MFIVYVLFSGPHQKHYTGFTSNLADRLLSHQALGKDWTSKFRPWKLIYTNGFADTNETMQYEQSVRKRK